MSDDNQGDNSRKGIPNSFLLLLLLVVGVVLFAQSLVSSYTAKVSDSDEVEHLVNLDMIRPERSTKTAMNDNLVTFTGLYRDKQTSEGIKRYKYLGLLASRHGLLEEQSKLVQNLSVLRQRTLEAADWFLHLRGISLPADGYRVIDYAYDTPEIENHVIVMELSSRDVETVPELLEKFERFGSSPHLARLDDFSGSLVATVMILQGPNLGIGDEPLKEQLRKMEKLLDTASSSEKTIGQRMDIYEEVLGNLKSLITTLDIFQRNVRLGKLRSVRDYRDSLDRYHEIIGDLELNERQLSKARASVSDVVWFYNGQELTNRSLEKQDAETFSLWFRTAKHEWKEFELNKGSAFKEPSQKRNLVLEKMFKSEEPTPDYMNHIITILLVVGVVMLLYFLFARQMKGMGGNAMNFGKSPAKMLKDGQNKISFKDVAGIDEAIEELSEIVDFLKNPGKYTALGATIPKGVLCVGPPGTGKTLIAKAVAGEAKRPFFLISGSDFVEMFVGVGASRIRDMFEQAKKNAPCIIFVDEIDAVGRHRGGGIGGGHDEREQTLNQLLVEMDGFDTHEGVILMAATNRPDVLDKALLRPGRFDRRVTLDLPDMKGRHKILELHARKIKIDDSVDLMTIARGTPGASGADLKNLLNEAALLAARKNRSCVTSLEVKEARDKVRYGKERRSLEMDDCEKESTAYHEAGHAVVGLVVENGEPIEKVTIIPRGFALGATHFLPKKNRISYWRKELIDLLAILMGGRIAEDIFVGDISSGAQNDIERVTGMARSMVCEWGMTDKLGAVLYDDRESGGQYLGMSTTVSKRYSDSTAKEIDEEVRILVDEANDRAREILMENKDKVELMTRMLIEFESLDELDVKKIMSGEWTVEDKRERLEKENKLHKKERPELPPIPGEKDKEPEGEKKNLTDDLKEQPSS